MITLKEETMVAHHTTEERREKPRIDCNYPAAVFVQGPSRDQREDHADVVDLSADGLRLSARREYAVGSKLQVQTRLSRKLPPDGPGPELWIDARVIWSKSRGEGVCQTGLKIESYKFK